MSSFNSAEDRIEANRVCFLQLAAAEQGGARAAEWSKVGWSTLDATAGSMGAGMEGNGKKGNALLPRMCRFIPVTSIADAAFPPSFADRPHSGCSALNLRQHCEQKYPKNLRTIREQIVPCSYSHFTLGHHGTVPHTGMPFRSKRLIAFRLEGQGELSTMARIF